MSHNTIKQAAGRSQAQASRYVSTFPLYASRRRVLTGNTLALPTAASPPTRRRLPPTSSRRRCSSVGRSSTKRATCRIPSGSSRPRYGGPLLPRAAANGGPLTTAHRTSRRGSTERCTRRVGRGGSLAWPRGAGVRIVNVLPDGSGLKPSNMFLIVLSSFPEKKYSPFVFFGDPRY